MTTQSLIPRNVLTLFRSLVFALAALPVAACTDRSSDEHELRPAAPANWIVDNSQSRISFVSVKAGDIGEAHQFNQLSGSLDVAGQVTVVIQLDSVDTAIPIRDERMRELLFRTSEFPVAKLRSQIDPNVLQELKVGQPKNITTQAHLTLGDAEIELTPEVSVARLTHGKLMVSSIKPIILNAAAVNLSEGIETLREIAGLPSISKAVPVSFVLTFVAE